MIVRHIGGDAVAAMARVDLAHATEEPPSQIEPFDFNGCRCGVASFVGSPPWERHTDGDELLHILSGRTRLTILTAGGEIVRELREGDLGVIPSGAWHRNHAPEGVTLLFMTPSEGNQHSWEAPDAS